jgi:hypothetical protein
MWVMTRPSGRFNVAGNPTKRLISRLATLKRRKRRAPSGFGCGGSVRVHTLKGAISVFERFELVLMLLPGRLRGRRSASASASAIESFFHRQKPSKTVNNCQNQGFTTKANKTGPGVSL